MLRALAFLSLLMIAALPAMGHAATMAKGSLLVSATVVSTCTVTSTHQASPHDTGTDVRTDVGVSCDLATPYQVSVQGGAIVRRDGGTVTVNAASNPTDRIVATAADATNPAAGTVIVLTY
ncbi:MAG: hypothetical protein PW843_19970 [Azospirillaceae bacterium]|nr:hypothetical protein [Azospirillaceae bacterium]